MTAAGTTASPGIAACAPRHVRVGILGAGLASLGMAIRLKHEGVEDFVVWERDADVGGTWWANTYPGCQCDVPSPLYSFSFAPNPEWRRTYAPQPEIQAYIRRVTGEFGLWPQHPSELRGQRRELGRRRARVGVATERGDYTAEALVAAPGPLSEPSIPRNRAAAVAAA